MRLTAPFQTQYGPTLCYLGPLMLPVMEQHFCFINIILRIINSVIIIFYKKQGGRIYYLTGLILYHWSEVKWSRSVMSYSLQPVDCSTPGSSPWDSPGKNTEVGCHFLLQGIFPTQGSNLNLPHGRQMLYPLSHQGMLHIIRHLSISLDMTNNLLCLAQLNNELINTMWLRMFREPKNCW